MTAGQSRPPISRIMVELGAVSDGSDVIETACSLAAAIQAEIYGLFVEEESLVNLSGLPFARAVLPGGREPRALSPELLRQAFEKQAATCRRVLSAQAGQTHLAWSFDTARGQTAAAIRAKLTRNDLVVVRQHAIGQSTSELIMTARSTATGASGVVVIGRQPPRPAGPIVAIDDGDAAGIETMTLAARMARRLDAPVELFVIARDDVEASEVEERDRALLGDARLATVHRLAGPPAAIEDALSAAAPRFVVADLEGQPFADNETAVRLIRAARAPIVLIRPRAAE